MPRLASSPVRSYVRATKESLPRRARYVFAFSRDRRPITVLSSSLRNRAMAVLSPRYYFCIPLSSRRDSRAQRFVRECRSMNYVYARRRFAADILQFSAEYIVPCGSPRGAKKRKKPNYEGVSRSKTLFSHRSNFHVSAATRTSCRSYHQTPNQSPSRKVYFTPQRHFLLSFFFLDFT